MKNFTAMNNFTGYSAGTLACFELHPRENCTAKKQKQEGFTFQFCFEMGGDGNSTDFVSVFPVLYQLALMGQ
jgi:hypothetical protein